MICENSNFCSYNMNNLDSRSERVLAMKSKYCMGESQQCALSYVICRISQGYILPDDHSLDKVGGLLMEMTPTDHTRARSLIKSMSLHGSMELPPLLPRVGREAQYAVQCGQPVT